MAKHMRKEDYEQLPPDKKALVDAFRPLDSLIDRVSCNQECSHEGACSLEPGHSGLHSASGFCSWED